MLDVKRDAQQFTGTAVCGAAYTMPSGSTLTFEYIANREGYSGQQAARYYAMGSDLSATLRSGAPDAQLASQVLGQAINPSLPLLGRNEIFAQFLKNNLHNKSDIILRYTVSFDDSSGIASAYATYQWLEHIQLFGLAVWNNGPLRSEYGRLLQFQSQIGVRFFIH
jgi:hypothetical protein